MRDLKISALKHRDWDKMLPLKRGDDGEWKEAQKRAFTRWVNFHLAKVEYPALENFSGFNSGTALIHLVASVYNVDIPKHCANPASQIYAIDNMNTGLSMLRDAGCKTTVQPEHLLDNDKMTLGMLWAMISDYSLAQAMALQQVKHTGVLVGDSMSVKRSLLQWVNEQLDSESQVRNFADDFGDGIRFLKLYAAQRPDLVDVSSLSSHNAVDNLSRAFDMGYFIFGVPYLILVDEFLSDRDEKAVIMYVGEMLHAFYLSESDESSRLSSSYKALLYWCREEIRGIERLSGLERLASIEELVVDRLPTHSVMYSDLRVWVTDSHQLGELESSWAELASLFSKEALESYRILEPVVDNVIQRILDLTTPSSDVLERKNSVTKYAWGFTAPRRVSVVSPTSLRATLNSFQLSDMVTCTAESESNTKNRSRPCKSESVSSMENGTVTPHALFDCSEDETTQDYCLNVKLSSRDLSAPNDLQEYSEVYELSEPDLESLNSNDDPSAASIDLPQRDKLIIEEPEQERLDTLDLNDSLLRGTTDMEELEYFASEDDNVFEDALVTESEPLPTTRRYTGMSGRLYKSLLEGYSLDHAGESVLVFCNSLLTELYFKDGKETREFRLESQPAVSIALSADHKSASLLLGETILVLRGRDLHAAVDGINYLIASNTPYPAVSSMIQSFNTVSTGSILFRDDVRYFVWMTPSCNMLFWSENLEKKEVGGFLSLENLYRVKLADSDTSYSLLLYIENTHMSLSTPEEAARKPWEDVFRTIGIAGLDSIDSLGIPHRVSSETRVEEEKSLAREMELLAGITARRRPNMRGWERGVLRLSPSLLFLEWIDISGKTTRLPDLTGIRRAWSETHTELVLVWHDEMDTLLDFYTTEQRDVVRAAIGSIKKSIIAHHGIEFERTHLPEIIRRDSKHSSRHVKVSPTSTHHQRLDGGNDTTAEDDVHQFLIKFMSLRPVKCELSVRFDRFVATDSTGRIVLMLSLSLIRGFITGFCNNGFVLLHGDHRAGFTPEVPSGLYHWKEYFSTCLYTISAPVASPRHSRTFTHMAPEYTSGPLPVPAEYYPAKGLFAFMHGDVRSVPEEQGKARTRSHKKMQALLTSIRKLPKSSPSPRVVTVKPAENQVEQRNSLLESVNELSGEETIACVEKWVEGFQLECDKEPMRLSASLSLTELKFTFLTESMPEILVPVTSMTSAYSLSPSLVCLCLSNSKTYTFETTDQLLPALQHIYTVNLPLKHPIVQHGTVLSSSNTSCLYWSSPSGDRVFWAHSRDLPLLGYLPVKSISSVQINSDTEFTIKTSTLELPLSASISEITGAWMNFFREKQVTVVEPSLEADLSKRVIQQAEHLTKGIEVKQVTSNGTIKRSVRLFCNPELTSLSLARGDAIQVMGPVSRVTGIGAVTTLTCGGGQDYVFESDDQGFRIDMQRLVEINTPLIVSSEVSKSLSLVTSGTVLYHAEGSSARKLWFWMSPSCDRMLWAKWRKNPKNMTVKGFLPVTSIVTASTDSTPKQGMDVLLLDRSTMRLTAQTQEVLDAWLAVFAELGITSTDSAGRGRGLSRSTSFVQHVYETDLEVEETPMPIPEIRKSCDVIQENRTWSQRLKFGRRSSPSARKSSPLPTATTTADRRNSPVQDKSRSPDKPATAPANLGSDSENLLLGDFVPDLSPPSVIGVYNDFSAGFTCRHVAKDSNIVFRSNTMLTRVLLDLSFTSTLELELDTFQSFQDSTLRWAGQTYVLEFPTPKTQSAFKTALFTLLYMNIPYTPSDPTLDSVFKTTREGTFLFKEDKELLFWLSPSCDRLLWAKSRAKRAAGKIRGFSPMSSVAVVDVFEESKTPPFRSAFTLISVSGAGISLEASDSGLAGVWLAAFQTLGIQLKYP